eukprot:jgi/Astpho2/2846/fgenesh1_pg.00050_%23_109_t
MPSITNIGGSLTSALALSLIAWAVRFIRGRRGARLQGSASSSQLTDQKQMGKFHAALSPAAVHMLVETDPILHYVIDIRSSEQRSGQPLPQDLQDALHIPGDKLQQVLSSKAAWSSYLKAPSETPATDPQPYPSLEHLLVFVGSSDEEMQAAAATAADLGFNRSMVLKGGLGAYSSAARKQADLCFLNRDALAALLGHVDIDTPVKDIAVIDLRRSDERSLYGSIPGNPGCIGTSHVPADQLPAALNMSSEEFEEAYSFPKPGSSDWLVMQCRTNRRSAWAAQVASDAGMQHCLVYRQGAYGWRLHPAVKAYSSFERHDVPPEPENVQTEVADAAAAKAELSRLGLLIT